MEELATKVATDAARGKWLGLQLETRCGRPSLAAVVDVDGGNCQHQQGQCASLRPNAAVNAVSSGPQTTQSATSSSQEPRSPRFAVECLRLCSRNCTVTRNWASRHASDLHQPSGGAPLNARSQVTTTPDHPTTSTPTPGVRTSITAVSFGQKSFKNNG